MESMYKRLRMRILSVLFSVVPVVAVAAPAGQENYAVRASVLLMQPFNPQALNDSFQSTNTPSVTGNVVSFQVTLYPYRLQPPIVANPNWKVDDAVMKEFLTPGPSTNWDIGMQAALLNDLNSSGIDPEQLDDLTLVQKVSKWALARMTPNSKMFDSYAVIFTNGVPSIFPGLQQFFDLNKGDPSWTDQDQFDHEILGKQMYFNQTYGTCTSYAIYQTTVLRALGIPTRMVLAIPIVDPSDPAQVAMVKSNIHDTNVQRAVLQALQPNSNSFDSHTFNEVYIGKQWVRLNYDALSQPILDPNYLGLMVHVNTFDDLSTANLTPTWGVRYADGLRDQTFQFSNPYRTTTISDNDQ